MSNLEILEAIRAGTVKPQNRVGALALLVASAAVFLLVGMNQWDLQRALILLVSIFIHECGHLAAMRAFGYKNLKILFIPSLGAVASGRPGEHDGLKAAIIAFAGPAVGILAAGAALLAWRASHSATLLDFALISLLLNGLNLLPILPMDGGAIVNETLVARYPKAEIAFRIAAAAALVALAVKLDGFGYVAIAAMLLMRTRPAYAMAAAINRLRATEGMMGAELTEEKVGRIREEIEAANPLLRKLSNLPNIPAEVEGAWARVNKTFPGVAPAAILLAAYLATLVVLIPLGVRFTARQKSAIPLGYNAEGIRRLERGDTKGALAAFDKALAALPTDPVILVNRGGARYADGNYAGAISDLTQSLARKPGVRLAYVYRALSYGAIGDYPREIDDCTSALGLSPDDPKMLSDRGYAEARTGRVDDAVRDCDRAVSLSQDKPEYVRLRAYVRDLDGDFAGAASDYQDAVKRTLGDDMAGFRWALHLRRQKLRDEEVGLLGRVPLFQDPWVRAIGLYLSGALDDAEFLDKAEARAPEVKSKSMGQAYYYVGMRHLLDGDFVGAHGYFLKSVDAGLQESGETGLAMAELGRLGAAGL